jgi:hypothetical protein
MYELRHDEVDEAMFNGVEMPCELIQKSNLDEVAEVMFQVG